MKTLLLLVLNISCNSIIAQKEKIYFKEIDLTTFTLEKPTNRF